MVRSTVQLDVWSDVICPWCWLGHARLAEAIRRLGITEEVELRWRAFQLDPGAPREPGDLRSSIEAKYGPGSFDAMSRRLTALGAEAGITYRFDIARRVNTYDAHRLIQAVQRDHGTAAAARLVDGLFRAYFSDGEDVADHDTLVRLAGSAGVPIEVASAVLSSDDGTGLVAEDRAAAREAGISGVPAFAWNGAVIIPGAQDVDTMSRVLQRLFDKVG